jgi:hypothetical protein
MVIAPLAVAPIKPVITGVMPGQTAHGFGRGFWGGEMGAPLPNSAGVGTTVLASMAQAGVPFACKPAVTGVVRSPRLAMASRCCMVRLHRRRRLG